MHKLIKAAKANIQAEDRGYTPLEVLGTLFLIGILIAFLIVRFLGWRDSAYDRDAQATARSVVLSAEAVYQDGLAYSATDTDYDAEVAALITGGDVELIGGGTELAIIVSSDSGTDFGMVLSATGQTQFCEDVVPGAADVAAALVGATCSTDGF